MSIYSPTEKASLCKIILRATHALLAASLEVCKHESVPASGSRNDNAAVRRAEGAAWACFIIERTPMVSWLSCIFLLLGRVHYNTKFLESRLQRHCKELLLHRWPHPATSLCGYTEITTDPSPSALTFATPIQTPVTHKPSFLSSKSASHPPGPPLLTTSLMGPRHHLQPTTTSARRTRRYALPYPY